MPSKKIIAIMTATALVVAGGGTAIAVSAAQAQAAPIQVTAYAEASTTRAQLAASAGALTTVAIDGVNLTTHGTGITSVASADLRLLAAAHARGKKVELLVGNFDGHLGDFSPTLAGKTLGSAVNTGKVVDAIVREVARHHWDGVTVDLESLTSDQAPGLTRFVRALNTALGSHRTLAVCLMATTGSYAALGYQLEPLGKAADRLMVMTYDQHGPSWSAAGPVGGLPWVTAALAPVLAKVKASHVELGIAGYGYSWPANGKTGRQYSVTAARALVDRDGATATWSTKQKEWHATLDNGTVLWWSDKRSYVARYDLARRLHLHGVAVWSLSLSDPLKNP